MSSSDSWRKVRKPYSVEVIQMFRHWYAVLHVGGEEFPIDPGYHEGDRESPKALAVGVAERLSKALEEPIQLVSDRIIHLQIMHACIIEGPEDVPGEVFPIAPGFTEGWADDVRKASEWELNELFYALFWPLRGSGDNASEDQASQTTQGQG